MTKLAEDRAVELMRQPDKVAPELERRLKEALRARGDFERIHPLPQSSADVPDDYDARLVVLSAEHPYAKEDQNPAQEAAKTILETRGNAPRLFRNTLVFLAADKVRYQDLDDALRRHLAWQSILAEKVELNLDPHQTKQAQMQLKAAEDTVAARLPETYQWLLAPEQATPQAPLAWKAIRLAGAGALAERAAKRLRNDELLVMQLGGAILRMHMDAVPLWRGENVSVRQLVEDFATYPYLPRLAGPAVLAGAVEAGLASFTWETDGFALADGYDEAAQRYLGLQPGAKTVSVLPESAALLVKPKVSRAQLDAEVPAASHPPAAKADGGGEADPALPTATPPSEDERTLRRFHGTVQLNPTRVGRDAGLIAEEVIAHLAGLVDAEVTVTLDIAANLPDGAPEHTVRTVSENSRTLKFDSHGFEEN